MSVLNSQQFQSGASGLGMQLIAEATLSAVTVFVKARQAMHTCHLATVRSLSLHHLPMWPPCNLITRFILALIPLKYPCSCLVVMESLIAVNLTCNSAVSLRAPLAPTCCFIQPHRFSIGDKSGGFGGHCKKCPPGTLAAMQAMFSFVL